MTEIHKLRHRVAAVGDRVAVKLRAIQWLDGSWGPGLSLEMSTMTVLRRKCAPVHQRFYSTTRPTETSPAQSCLESYHQAEAGLPRSPVWTRYIKFVVVCYMNVQNCPSETLRWLGSQTSTIRWWCKVASVEGWAKARLEEPDGQMDDGQM